MMRIVSFFPKPLPQSIAEGLKETARIVYWSDLSDEERKDLSDVEIVISNPPVKMDKALLSFFPNLKMIASLGVGFDKFDLTTNFTAVAATFNNIGPGLNVVGPTGNFAGFSMFSKIVLIFDMLAGRLEIFPMLILLAPGTWKK